MDETIYLQPDDTAAEQLRPARPASDHLIVTKQSEVIVVGAGPAGIVAAIAARRLDLQATVLDARIPPINKPCGEGILPQGVAALGRLGISFPPESVFPFRGIRFVDGEHSARADFAGATGFSVRRVKLHQLLLNHAVEAGVEFRWGTRVMQIDTEAVTTAKEKFSYRWLVGADGQNSHGPQMGRTRSAYRPKETIRFLQPLSSEAMVGRG